MKKIVAIGGGRYDDGEIINIFEYIVSLAEKKNPKVLFIPTAGRDDINGDEHIQYGFEKFGCNYDILYLTDEKRTVDDIRSVIMAADIIYVGGGDVEFMMKTWRKTGADKALIEAYNSGKVMSGYSAGAVCWFDSAYDDCGPDHSFVFCDCLGILPYCACPHFESKSWQSFKTAIKTRPEQGLAIENGAAFIFKDEMIGTIRGNDGGDVWILDGDDELNISTIVDKMNRREVIIND